MQLAYLADEATRLAAVLGLSAAHTQLTLGCQITAKRQFDSVCRVTRSGVKIVTCADPTQIGPNCRTQLLLWLGVRPDGWGLIR